MEITSCPAWFGAIQMRSLNKSSANLIDKLFNVTDSKDKKLLISKS